MVQSLDREFFIHSNFEISNCKNMQRDTIICNIFLYRTKDRAITNVLVDLSFRYRFYEYFEFYKILYRIECNHLFRCILLTKLRICINNRSLAWTSVYQLKTNKINFEEYSFRCKYVNRCILRTIIFFLLLRKIKTKKEKRRKSKLYTEKFYLEEFIRFGYRRKLYQSQAVLCENRLWEGKQRTEITMYEWEMKNKGALVVPWGDA